MQAGVHFPVSTSQVSDDPPFVAKGLVPLLGTGDREPKEPRIGTHPSI